MVATRRGVRVSTPAETNAEQTADVPATPSTSRRTRRTAKQAESPTQHVLVETSSQLEKSEGRPEASTPGSVLKRCSRASRLHSPELPCTPVGSVHEADMSDCSAVSDVELPMTRTTGGRRQPRTASQEDEEISEVESCSSAVSSSKSSQSRRRSTRRKTVNKCPDPACVEAGDVAVDLVSESQRVTRSQRKKPSTRSSAKQQTEDSELSDADSCVSSVSGADFPKSTTRRPRRSMRQTGPIPIQLDEASEGSQSPVTRAATRRAARGKAVDASESQSCDSEGFESGPTYSMMTRRRGKSQSRDSDSDLTDAQSHMGSPCKKPSRGTPCSSRTGSGSSIRSARATRSAVKECSIVLEKTKSAEEETSLNDSTLESTVIYQDADRTLLEEDENQTSEEKEEGGVTSTDLTSAQAETRSVEKGVIVIEDDPHQGPPLTPDSPGRAEEAVSQPAVTVVHQQEEPCAENQEDISEKETMQERIAPSEPLRPCESDTGALRESASEDAEQPEEKDEAVEVADASLGDEDAVVETGPDEDDDDDEEEEKMEVSILNSDAQQVDDSDAVRVESIQVTSSQQHNITAEPEPEQPPKDVSIQNTKRISLLDSSDDEESDGEESKVSGKEEEEEEEREGPSQKCEAAAASVDGLFMLDTRPGQDADDEYYKGRPTEEDTKQGGVEQEEDEEFVDEEGDDDDEDEDAELLFSGRDPQLKELSSRIDPGIRLKELGGLYINFDGSKSKPVSTSLRKLKEKKIQDEVMKKSVMGPDFEKKDSVPPYSESKQALKMKRRAEREKSTGDGWFNMKAPEITPELKADLQVLKMRGSRDPKRFYKKNDRDGFPKYFQVGTVVDSPVDFYHSRVPKKERKRTMVEELLSDAEFRQNNKKKYQHIVTEKVAQGAGRKNKKKSRFHKK